MEISELKVKLNELVQDLEFLKLDKILKKNINVFQILGIETKEVFYSRMIAWLLNPNENHDFGADFLREFLKELFKNNQTYFKNKKIDFIDIDCINLQNTYVAIEKTILSNRRIDIFVKIDNGREKWIIIIENKINSLESPNQTIFYEKEVSTKFPDYTKICVFLNPEGNIPSSKDFIPCDYEFIKNLIDKMLQNSEEKVENYLLSQFSKSIEVFVMNNPELENLLRNLYERYCDIFSFLFKKFAEFDIGQFQDVLSTLAQKIEQELGENFSVYFGKTWINVFKNDWFEIQNKKGWDSSKYFKLVIYSFLIVDDKLRFKIESYTSNKTIREKFRQELINIFSTNKELSQKIQLNLNNKQSWLNNIVENDIHSEIEMNLLIEKAVREIKKYSDILSPIFSNIFENL